MKEIERRIYISDEIFNNEYSFTYGERKNEIVNFHYYHIKKDRESHPIPMTYTEALAFARYRANDKRYRNYEFLIK